MNKKNKKEYKVDEKKVMRSIWYRFSRFIINIPTALLVVLAIGVGIASGAVQNMNANLYANIANMSADEFINQLINVCIWSTVVHHFICVFAKGARLNIINENYLKLFKHALKSKVGDIAEVGPERILSSVESIAVLRASINASIIEIVKATIPFAIIVWSLWKMNHIAAWIVVLVMAVCIALQINGNNIFHFDSIKSAMKADMRGISTNQFIVIRMLKYMHAEKWAWDRLDRAQAKAAPSLHNSLSQVFSSVIFFVTMIPEIIVMSNALITGDTTLAIYLGFNMGAVYNMIYVLIGMAETKSELGGELNTFSKLNADDGYAEDSFDKELLSFPVSGVHLIDEWFYYKSDEDHDKPFIIEDFKVEDGKWYRIEATSGAGKSTLFRFFAGEMESEWKPDFEIFYIHQEAQLVKYESIYENIVLGNDNIPRSDVMELLEDVRLGNWVRSLSKGIDTIIGTDVNPSGGEASRLSLLRLFVYLRNYDSKGRYDKNNKRHPLILLDEVTSALDKRTYDLKEDELSTEEMVIKVVERECQGCTMLVISHEDETSKAYGFRNIVDYTCRMDVRNEDGLEKHILHKPVATGNNKNGVNRVIDITHRVKEDDNRDRKVN